MIKSIFVIYYFITLIWKNDCRNSPIYLRNFSEFASSVKTWVLVSAIQKWWFWFER